MRCIMCLKEKQPSDEHVIPTALGGALIIDRVCKDCNDKFGQKADAGLVKQYQIEQRRIKHGLKGQSGALPDPLKAALRHPIPGVHSKDHRVLVRRESGTGELAARTIPKVEFEVQTFPNQLYRIECKTCYIDPREGANIENIVKKALRRAGLTDDKVIQEAWEHFSGTLTEQEEHLTFQSTIEQNTGGHQLGVLKIAYEMVWYWLGDSWLEDEQAEVMRSALRGEAPLMQAAVFDAGRFFLEGPDNSKMHLVFIFPAMGKLMLVVRLLDVLAVGFIATSDPTRYTLPAKDTLVMNAVTKQSEFLRLNDIVTERKL